MADKLKTNVYKKYHAHGHLNLKLWLMANWFWLLPWNNINKREQSYYFIRLFLRSNYFVGICELLLLLQATNINIRFHCKIVPPMTMWNVSFDPLLNQDSGKNLKIFTFMVKKLKIQIYKNHGQLHPLDLIACLTHGRLHLKVGSWLTTTAFST